MWLSVPPWVLDYPLFGSAQILPEHFIPPIDIQTMVTMKVGITYPDRLIMIPKYIVTKGIIGFVIKIHIFYGG